MSFENLLDLSDMSENERDYIREVYGGGVYYISRKRDTHFMADERVPIRLKEFVREYYAGHHVRVTVGPYLTGELDRRLSGEFQKRHANGESVYKFALEVPDRSYVDVDRLTSGIGHMPPSVLNIWADLLDM
jgi:hypothetical protein